ncbi:MULTISPECIES: succinylglutamate desuccinylase/aspartoacylase family protein [unclassified Legionella]|uniref:succinylglutamate desuccinylase/aspartoacylase family protein n=1 Tax=unclassified Legionella TaxID=2622702 RepID=UPI001056C884|nr:MULTISPECIES: succinylglutamate desuccinylase/aspartoacylase family protein [unclassified Legionella]MDI9819240.1 M14 family metallopeptidase [Legionella sp. PL877]
MKNSNLTFFNTTIHPGEISNLALPLPEFYSCSSFQMPIKIIHGKQAGPCLLIFSAVKGDELNGLEIINRLLKLKAIRHLRGTLIAIPVLNVLGLINHPKTLTYETSLERCFPGHQLGSYGERIAHLFTQEILPKVDHCIELQTGSLNHDILPQIYCNLENPDSRRLAQQFAAPVITHVSKNDNSLRQTIENLTIPLLVYQAGEAMRIDETAISLGLSGIQNVMYQLGMLKQAPFSDNKDYKSIFSQDQDWLRAPHSGVLHSDIVLGQMIKKGQTLGLISDPFSADTIEPVKSPRDGIVVGINRHPLIHEGQTLFKIASFIDNDRAEIALEAWNEVLENQ